MAKPNNKQKRQTKELKIVESLGSKKESSPYGDGDTKEDKSNSFFEKILIVCEGETEAAYFESLVQLFKLTSKYNFTILPRKSKDGEDTPYKGSSLKGLLKEVEKENIRVKYDENWIVIDNDENNSYKLDQASIERIKSINGIQNQWVEELERMIDLDVRSDEDEENKKRIRYFLSRIDFENYLTNDLSIPNEIVHEIIRSTTKKNEFDEYYQNPKPAIKVAYSCISFEHWILLHFEENTNAFYNSRELLHYFDRNGFLIFPSSEDLIYFKKGWQIYNFLKRGSKEQRDIVEHFINNAHFAILNNITLNTKKQSDITEGKKFYEINPYSDIYKLVYRLRNNSNLYIANTKSILTIKNKENINIITNGFNINISYTYTGKKSILTKEILESISVFKIIEDEAEAETSKTIDIYSSDNSPITSHIVREGDKVNISISLNEQPSTSCLLFYKEKNKKGCDDSFVWVVNFDSTHSI